MITRPWIALLLLLCGLAGCAGGGSDAPLNAVPRETHVTLVFPADGSARLDHGAAEVTILVTLPDDLTLLPDQAVIDWGDDSPPEIAPIDGAAAFPLRFTHRFATVGDWFIAVQLRQGTRVLGSGSTAVTVLANSAPQL
ncbi:MAG: hypothetical protein ABI743_00485, partial [bacterium]